MPILNNHVLFKATINSVQRSIRRFFPLNAHAQVPERVSLHYVRLNKNLYFISGYNSMIHSL